MSDHAPTRRHPILRAIAGVAAVAVLLISATSYAAARKYDSKIQRVSVFGGAAAADHPAQVDDSLEPMNVLLVGIDNRAGLTAAQKQEWHLGSGDYGNQTDTIMIIHIGRDGDHVTMVSLPRDSLVTIPAYTDADGTQHAAQQNRINAAFTLGGAALTVRTVEQATGIHIDHYVGVNFLGFNAMVDAVGGVDVCLAEPIKDNPKYTALDLPAGKSTISGRMALSFVRARHVGTDFGRMARQQQFMASLLKKATSLGIVTNPLKLDAFVSAAADSLEVDENLDRTSILHLAERLSSIKLDQIEFAKLPIADDNYTIPGTDRSGFVTWGETGSRRIFDAMINDTPLIVPRAATPTASPTAASTGVAPKNVSVQVFNGSGTSGLGTTASNDLQAIGFTIAAPAAASPDPDRNRTLVRYDPTQSAAAATLRKALPDADYAKVTGLGPTIQVTIGSTFSGVRTIASGGSTTTADPSAATVSPKKISVHVLNGSGVTGRGKQASSDLEGLGYVIASPADSSPNAPISKTVVRYDSSLTEEVKTLRETLPGATFEAVDGLGSVIQITVGSSYSGVTTPTIVASSSSATPTSADPTDISAEQKPVLAASTVCN